jgi:hypothetical protein
MAEPLSDQQGWGQISDWPSLHRSRRDDPIRAAQFWGEKVFLVGDILRKRAAAITFGSYVLWALCSRPIREAYCGIPLDARAAL